MKLNVDGKEFVYDDTNMSLISTICQGDKEQTNSKSRHDCVKIRTNNTILKRRINRITLCVSNNCNLRCKYCYAQGGDYGATRFLMTLQTAKHFVAFCERNFDSINKIVFFGGEPLLNIKVVEFVCESITDVYKKSKFGIPEFCIVTNGTILNSNIINLCKRYIGRITVSIDGPESLHDLNRVRIDGNGSHKAVVNFIEEIKKLKTINLSYEATFTQRAVNEGFNHMKLKRYFKDTFGLSGAIVNDSHLDKKYVMGEFNKQVQI